MLPQHVDFQPRSQGLRGETVTKTLVKFILSFQNFGKKIACTVRHNRIAITDLNYWIKLLSCIIEANGGHIGLSHINLHWYY